MYVLGHIISDTMCVPVASSHCCTPAAGVIAMGSVAGSRDGRNVGGVVAKDGGQEESEL